MTDRRSGPDAGWLQRVREQFLGPDPRAEGTEPDPRFSFANERTFLAWNRTALALIGVGLAVTQLLPPFDLTGGRHAIGLPLIGLGTVLSIASLRDWARNERALRLGRPLPRSRLGLITAVVVGVVGLIALVVAAGWGLS
jgi:putative membrane protein